MIGLFIFFTTFLVYLLTSYPTIPFHDAGDMVSAAYLLGIPHPTGYPFFTLLGKLFITLIPFGNIAFRMNILSSLFASLCIMMVYFITLNLTQNSKLFSIVASLVLAFSKTFWEQAIIAEKYTLNALFFTLILFVLIKWKERRKNYFLYLASFLLGLSFTHHMQTLFLIPGGIFFILAILWKNEKKVKSQTLKVKISCQNFLAMATLFILPLFLYLFLPIRSASHPYVNWGDPDRLNGFIDYLTAKGYAHYFEKSSLLEYLKRGFSHWRLHIINQFSLLFFPSLIGFFLLILKQRDIFILFLLIVLANTAHCTHYNIPNVWDYYFPVYIILSISFGFLFFFIASLHKALSFLVILSIFLPLYPFSKHIKSHNKSGDYSYYDEGMGYLKPLKKNAIFLTKGDICFVLWYLHYVENVRSDIFLINGTFLHTFWLMDEINKTHPELIFDRSLPNKRVSSLELANIRFEKYREIMDRNASRYIIYTPFSDEVTKGFRLAPDGFVNRVIGKETGQTDYIKMIRSANFNVLPYQARSKQLMNNVKNGYIRQGVLFSELGMNLDAIISFKNVLNLDPKDKEAITNLSKCYYNLALDFDQKGLLKEAENYYKKSIETDSNMIDAYFNLGLLYHKRNNPKMAIYYWKSLLEKDPRNIKTAENLATIYYNSGNFKEARLTCQRILTLQPSNNLANQMLQAIKLQKGFPH